MKNGKEKKTANKFDLDKMSVAKLKNLHLIRGGGGNGREDDPIETTATKGMQASTVQCIG